MKKQRIKKLQTQMKKEGIAYYMIPTSDFHNSESKAAASIDAGTGNLPAWSGLDGYGECKCAGISALFYIVPGSTMVGRQ